MPVEIKPNPQMDSKAIIAEGRRVLKIESEQLIFVAERLDEKFADATELILKTKGKLICTGVGKSGLVARKVASTFASTGTPSVFVHPTESKHGDLGVISDGDTVLAMSYGGESDELAPLLQYCQRRGVPMIAITGKSTSTLATSAQVSLDAKVEVEACPLGLAPTSSSTATLAIGDALAMAVLKCRGFREEDFAEFHPGGSLGRKLLTRVQDVMHKGEALPVVRLATPLSEVLGAMTAKQVQGVAGVVDEQESVVGVITDGDLRRFLRKPSPNLSVQAKELMSQNPKTIDCNELAQKALFVMEQFRIQTLFVVDKGAPNPKKPVGLLHIQDLIQAKVR